MSSDDLDALLEADTWRKPAARHLALLVVALAAPCALRRPLWAAQVAYAALTGRKRIPRG